MCVLPIAFPPHLSDRKVRHTRPSGQHNDSTRLLGRSLCCSTARDVRAHGYICHALAVCQHRSHAAPLVRDAERCGIREAKWKCYERRHRQVVSSARLLSKPSILGGRIPGAAAAAASPMASSRLPSVPHALPNAAQPPAAARLVLRNRKEASPVIWPNHQHLLVAVAVTVAAAILPATARVSAASFTVRHGGNLPSPDRTTAPAALPKGGVPPSRFQANTVYALLIVCLRSSSSSPVRHGVSGHKPSQLNAAGTPKRRPKSQQLRWGPLPPPTGDFRKEGGRV